MKKTFLFFILILLFIVFSCQEQSGGGEFAQLYNVIVEPSKAKIGDVVSVIYELKNIHYRSAIDYNKDTNITDEGNLEYYKTYIDRTKEKLQLKKMGYFGISENEYGKFNSKNRINHQEVVKFKSIKEEIIDNGNKRKVTVECFVPQNAKSGYFEFVNDIEWGNEYRVKDEIIRFAPFTVLDASGDIIK